MVKRILAVVSLSCSTLFAIGQQDTIENNTSVVGVKLHYGSIYIHTKSVENVAGARPFGAEVELSTLKAGNIHRQRCHCLPRAGITLSYFNLDHPVLGHSIAASYFIEPSYRLTNKLDFKLRAAIGVTYVTNPFDADKNPSNRSYTTRINPLLQVGIGAGYAINSQYTLTAMGHFLHFSNGGFKEPNRGVNWVTASVGVLYSPVPVSIPAFKREKINWWRNNKTSIEAGIMLLPRQSYSSYLKGQRTFLAGIFTQATKQVGGISGITAGAEFYYNKVERPPGYTAKNAPFVAGIHAGHAFLLGKVTFDQMIGTYLLNETVPNRKTYLRWGLGYNISNRFQAGISLKSHFDNADFADFKIRYRLR